MEVIWGRGGPISKSSAVLVSGDNAVGVPETDIDGADITATFQFSSGLRLSVGEAEVTVG